MCAFGSLRTLQASSSVQPCPFLCFGFGSLRTLQVSSSVQSCRFFKCFGFAITFAVLTLVMLFFALAVPLGVVFVSLVCPVPLCSCFLRSTTQRPDHTTPSADRQKEFERDTQRERESRRRRSNEDGEELACVTLFCLKDFPADSRGPRLLGPARRGTGLNVAEGAQKRFSPLRFCTRIGRRFE